MYKAMARVFSVVLALVAVGALIGGLFAHNYVTDQLTQEKITMPDQASIAKLPQESQDALKPFIGQKMDNGTQAQAYANHYIWEHMQSQCKAVKTSDGKTLTVPADKCTYSGIADFTKEYQATLTGTDAEKAKDPGVVALNAAREQNFKGDTLRSMLLTAYGFWLIGTIAFWAAGVAALGAVALAVFGWMKPKATTVEQKA